MTSTPDDTGPYCSLCGRQDKGAIINCGIGPGEAWGKPFNDVDMRYLSTCCEAVLFDNRDMQVEADWPEPPEAA